MQKYPAPRSASFPQRVAIAVVFAILGVGLAYFLYQVAGVLVLLFAGVMLAVFLDGMTRLVGRVIEMPRPWALAAVLLLLCAMAAASVQWLGAPLAAQLTALAERVPSSMEQVRERLQDLPWGGVLLQRLPELQSLLPLDQSGISRIFGLFSSALGALTSAFVVVALGVYLAINPAGYVGAVRHLAPLHRRSRVDTVALAMGRALRHWLVGRLASMLTVGVLTGIGLWILGAPLPLSLAFITALFVFVPYIGPILSLIPAVLVALSESFAMAFYVGALYLGVQLLESYVITPMIQKRAVSLPPGYLISAQVIAGVLFGGFGVALAAPFVVMVTVVVQMLYVQDVLGDHSAPVLGNQPIFRK